MVDDVELKKFPYNWILGLNWLKSQSIVRLYLLSHERPITTEFEVT
jgi:hypothetical protein